MSYACYLDDAGGDGKWIIVEASNEDDAIGEAEDIAIEERYYGEITEAIKMEHGVELSGPGF